MSWPTVAGEENCHVTLQWPWLLFLNVPGRHNALCAHPGRIPAMLPSRGPEPLESSDFTRLLGYEGSRHREPFLRLLRELVLPFQTPAALPRRTASQRKLCVPVRARILKLFPRGKANSPERRRAAQPRPGLPSHGGVCEPNTCPRDTQPEPLTPRCLSAFCSEYRCSEASHRPRGPPRLADPRA